MAKIVVLASGDDADAATTALEGAGLDFEIVEPKPANLLHIVIGMVGDDEDEEGEDKPKKEKKEKAPADEPPADEPPADEPPADDADIASDASAVPESLGSVRIDDEMIKAVRGSGPVSVLRSARFEGGPRTVYSINESEFSFWPSNPTKPMHRIIVEHGSHRSSLEVLVAAAPGNQSYLEVGADLAALFDTK